jgi:NADH-quinone oxidoreductase subunit L
MTGEPEDTDVGFPGPEHHIAERAQPMKVAMAILAALSIIGGVLQIPGVTHVIETFLEGTFEESSLAGAVHVSEGSAWLGLLAGGAVGIAGIALAYFVYVVRPGTTDRIRERLGAVHAFLYNKWYFDELYDTLVYRPTIAAGRFANDVFERVVVDGLVAATVGVVRGVSVSVRGAQSGFVRAYALLVVTGFAGLGLYFLIVSS